MGLFSQGHRPDRGAALVEFAVLAPLLVILVMGIVEFGWAFGQYNDVRHGAREGARFAAVNAGNNTAIADHVCQAMDGLDSGMTQISIEFSQSDTDGSAGITRGDTGSITVIGTISSLTGMPVIRSFLPSTLRSSVEFRLEQDPTSWTDITGTPILKTSCP